MPKRGTKHATWDMCDATVNLRVASTLCLFIDIN